MPESLRAHDPRVLGRYQVTARLGEGGQGTVYLGHSTTGDRVAIKLLKAELAEDKSSRRRFIREIQTAQRVPPVFTARVLEADVAGQRPYIVSEFLDAPSLQVLVSRQGPLQGEHLQRFVYGTAAALAAIHQAGVVHRDFKPANVLMTPDGPRVIDFGIARALDMTTTLTSSVVGTPSYMAPEQFTASDPGDEGRAADIFAWAATMAYAATGRAPFGTNDIGQVMHRILYVPPDLGRIHGGLRELLTECMAKDPDARPTATQLTQRLQTGTGATPVGGTTVAMGIGGPGAKATGKPRGRKPGKAGKAGKPGKPGRSKRLLLASACAFLLLGGSVGGYLLFGRTPDKAAADQKPGQKPDQRSGQKDERVLHPQPGRLEGTEARLVTELDDGVSLVSYSTSSGDETNRRVWMLPAGKDGRFETRQSLNDIDYLDVSPSGRWLAVARDPDEKANGKVYVMDRTGVTTALRIPPPTDDSAKTTQFLWAPKWDRKGEELMINVGEQRKGEDGTFLDGLEFSAPFTTGGTRRFQELDHQTFEWRPGREGFVANDEDNERSKGNRPDLIFYDRHGKRDFVLENAGWLAVDAYGTLSPSGDRLVTHCGIVDRPQACLWQVGAKRLIGKVDIDDPNPLNPGSGTLGWYDEDHIVAEKTRSNGRQDLVVMDLDGKVTKTLMENTEDISYTLSPSRY